MCSLVLCSPCGPENLTVEPARHPPGAWDICHTHEHILPDTQWRGSGYGLSPPLTHSTIRGPSILSGWGAGRPNPNAQLWPPQCVNLRRGDSCCPSHHTTCPSGPSPTSLKFMSARKLFYLLTCLEKDPGMCLLQVPQGEGFQILLPPSRKTHHVSY